MSGWKHLVCHIHFCLFLTIRMFYFVTNQALQIGLDMCSQNSFVWTTAQVTQVKGQGIILHSTFSLKSPIINIISINATLSSYTSPLQPHYSSLFGLTLLWLVSRMAGKQFLNSETAALDRNTYPNAPKCITLSPFGKCQAEN